MDKRLMQGLALACVVGLLASHAAAGTVQADTLTFKESVASKVFTIPVGVNGSDPRNINGLFEFNVNNSSSLSLSFACAEDPKTFTKDTEITLHFSYIGTNTQTSTNLFGAPYKLSFDPKYIPGVSTSGKISGNIFDFYHAKFTTVVAVTWKLSKGVFTLTAKSTDPVLEVTFADQYINAQTFGIYGVRFPAGTTKTNAIPVTITASIASTTRVYNALYNVVAVNTPYLNTTLWQGKAKGFINFVGQ